MIVASEAKVSTFGGFCRTMRIVVCLIWFRLFWKVFSVLSISLGPAGKSDAGFDPSDRHGLGNCWAESVEKVSACQSQRKRCGRGDARKTLKSRLRMIVDTRVVVVQVENSRASRFPQRLHRSTAQSASW